MHIRRKKAFRQLFRLIRTVEADPYDLTSVRELNLVVLGEILRDERALLRHRKTQRTLITQLKTGRGTKTASTAIRSRLKRLASYIRARQDNIFIWKCFGDALVCVYVDTFSVKHAFFEIDRLDIKQNAGMISNKEGLQQETALLLEIIDLGVPAVLCDITNVLRHGDLCLCLPDRSDPILVEVKSSPRLNQRGKRQLANLGPVEIHRELMTAAARWIIAWKLWSVLSARMAIRLNSLSLQKKFSIR